jgi:N-formylglutamate amidohydrolase
MTPGRRNDIDGRDGQMRNEMRADAGTSCDFQGDDCPAPFQIFEPQRLAAPLIFNSPHSGRYYPSRFLNASRLDALTLRRSEDAFVDELFAPCVGLGAPLMRANFPRALLDVNREPFELDPLMFEGRLPAFANTRSLRVAGGLGTIPRVVGDAQEIYKGLIPIGEALARVEALYKPYHQALRGLIERAIGAFGLMVLLDCHSMPSSMADGAASDFVIGDRYGASAAPWIIETVENGLRRAGYSVRRNKPYAGGFITEHYGAPAVSRHVVQIEINRALYMDERAMAKSERWGVLSADLLAMASQLANRVAYEVRWPPIAAE